MKPLHQKVAVRPLDDATMHGSIILVREQDKAVKAIVEASAGDCEELQDGDCVLIRNWIGDKVKICDKDCILVDETEVLAKVVGE